jgi:hypothetical protein
MCTGTITARVDHSGGVVRAGVRPVRSKFSFPTYRTEFRSAGLLLVAFANPTRSYLQPIQALYKPTKLNPLCIGAWKMLRGHQSAIRVRGQETKLQA